MKPTIDDLIQLHLENSAEANAQLNDALRTSPELRSAFAAFLVDEEIMVEELKMEEIDSIIKGSESQALLIDSQTQGASASQGAWNRGLTKWAIAAAIMFSVTGIIFWQNLHLSDQEPPAQAALGVIEKSTAAAEWANGYDPAQPLEPGEYQLLAGRVQVQLRNGVELQVQGPAEFTFVSDFEIGLSRGSIRASVPPSGHGFTVATDEVKIRDLGTEFGVVVNDATELHVFSGEVELSMDDGSVPAQRVRDGFAARWSSGQRRLIAISDEQDFLNKADINYSAWRASRERTLNDRDLVFYSNFSEYDQGQAASKPDTPLKANQMRLVQGRWRETKAMLFDGPNDWASYDFDESDSFTIGMWVKVDRYDQSLQTLVNSERWGGGGHHLQLTNAGALRVGVGGLEAGGGDGYAATLDSKPIKPGKWAHVLCSFNHETRQIFYFVDGEQVGSGVVPEHVEVKLGRSHIGAWKSGSSMVRGLRGRIDEFVVYRRAMSADEVAKEFHQGEIN